MQIRQVKKESVDSITLKSILEYLSDRQFRLYEPTPTSLVSYYVYLFQDKKSNYHLIYRDYNLDTVRHIVFDPYTGEQDPQIEINNAGARAYRKMKKFCKKYNEDINYIHNDEYYKYTWIPFEYMDPYNCNKVINNCYEYDSNSNYLSKFKLPLPYGDIVREDDYVNKGEIGFNIVYNNRHQKALEAIFYGKANIIFKTKIYKGLCEFADYMYKERMNLPEGEERDKFKTIICASHGNLKYHNIFMAVAILGYSQEEIQKYESKAHIYMNTVDSIVCDKPIDDIPLGDKLGQFKLKHKNERFRYVSHGIKYWENGEIKYKGLKKSRLDENGNLKPLKYKIINKELIQLWNKE